jgi:DNA-binding beta-propeller fold protein YncE
VHAASESADTMVVFDKKGRFVRSWGREFKGGAHGLHVRKEGREEFLYLCDTQQAIVVKTTLRGEIVWKLDYPEESPAYEPGSAGKRKKYSPTNVAVAPNGDVYVADGYGSNYINQYDYNGKFIRSFGGTGKEAGQVSCPHGLIVDLRSGQPELLVADRTNKRLQWFSMDGKHLRFGEGVILPCHFHERKGVMVIPDLQSRVTLLGRDNKVIAHLGENPEPFNNLRKQPRGAFPEAKFICPHGACFDRDGNIFVVEWVEVGRVTKLRKV